MNKLISKKNYYEFKEMIFNTKNLDNFLKIPSYSVNFIIKKDLLIKLCDILKIKLDFKNIINETLEYMEKCKKYENSYITVSNNNFKRKNEILKCLLIKQKKNI